MSRKGLRTRLVPSSMGWNTSEAPRWTALRPSLAESRKVTVSRKTDRPISTTSAARRLRTTFLSYTGSALCR
jgi:hypothetical protein